ncbi:MAG: hypothetical protein MUO21_05420, partial [Nitrososphaeraceae archaeon]|nr:hypothetical protein [Nitrososphaeraceae archaeon]
MAASSEKRIHRIGPGSVYDADINQVEDLVESFHNPQNENMQYSVFLYYESRAHSYLNHVEKYINSPDAITDIKSGALMAVREENPTKLSETRLLENLTTIQNNIGELKLKFDQMIDKAKKDYNATKVFSPEPFMNIFYFISLIYCFIDLKKIKSATYKKALFVYQDLFGSFLDLDTLIYPLPNDTGFFCINSYLYACLEGISLIGIPMRPTYFDGEFACAAPFVNHDLRHTVSINRNLDEKQKAYYKIFYHAILESDLSQAEKELHILIMWLIVHEFEEDVFFYQRGKGKNV